MQDNGDDDRIHLALAGTVAAIKSLLGEVEGSLEGAEEAFRAFERLFAKLEAGAIGTPAMGTDGRRMAETATTLMRQLRERLQTATRDLNAATAQLSGGSDRAPDFTGEWPAMPES